MATFRVGDHARVVLPPPSGKTRHSRIPAARLGCEVIVVGTRQCPNAGFAPTLGDYSVRLIGHTHFGMVSAYQLVPIKGDEETFERERRVPVDADAR